jgi:hypothetical protein
MADENDATASEPDHAASIREKLGKWEAVASIFGAVFRWGGLVGIAYFGFRAIEALSGNTTVADIGLN